MARTHWTRPGRAASWWVNIQNGQAVEEEWKEHFRMTRKSFQVLCDELRPFIQRQRTNMRRPVSVETQVAATLYFLSDGERMRKTGLAW